MSGDSTKKRLRLQIGLLQQDPSLAPPGRAAIFPLIRCQTTQSLPQLLLGIRNSQHIHTSKLSCGSLWGAAPFPTLGSGALSDQESREAPTACSDLQVHLILIPGAPGLGKEGGFSQGGDMNITQLPREGTGVRSEELSPRSAFSSHLG